MARLIQSNLVMQYRHLAICTLLLACCIPMQGPAACFAQEATQQREKRESVKPGINREFLSPDLQVEEWIGRFETESREVFTAREAILAAVKLEEGMQVADVGAGTGLFTRLFSERVGAGGWVYAVDISPKFAAHLAGVADASKLANITPVLCAEDSVLLPPESVDLVFVCDTYHHFEYPRATLASIHRALKPGGRLAVIDFERIEGKSREWTLDHVRAGKEVFQSEIEAAGFEFAGESDVEGLVENYFLMFRKPLH
jgi:SAM-dependent methyltransferase